MDARVKALIDELSHAENIEPLPTRERITALFDDVQDEQSRVALLHVFHSVMSMTVRHMEASGQDTTGLKNAILADKRLFAIREAQLDGENIDPDALHYVVEREVAAGRMERDSFGELAQSGAAVLGRGNGPEEPRPSLFRRIFG